MTTSTNDQQTMAQQAMTILDNRGEFAMLPFMMSQADPDADRAEWQSGGLCRLHDGSYVLHCPKQYQFQWYEKGQLKQDVRNSEMPVQGRPYTTSYRMPLITDPTVEDVWSRVIQDLEQKAGLDLNDPVVERAETYQLAPDLHNLIQRIATDGHHNELMDKYHSFVLSSYSGNVIDQLPENQTEALTEVMVQRNKNQKAA